MTHGESINFGLIEWYPKKKRYATAVEAVQEEIEEQLVEVKGKGLTDSNQ